VQGLGLIRLVLRGVVGVSKMVQNDAGESTHQSRLFDREGNGGS